ncbi:L-rhamnose mutarotase [Sphaerotilus hippei]|uniref:L-rhamnose mutarotase n=1 Tax=Sphaerotilus hippei TaxID=744406 RepID=A0A318HDT9_9BURK|nr:L-rhamnose mutarotase [Sphaerotilus hippei]PXW99419.1 L-rhamnose mutarotase [Sphaerotilus hippei]
MTRSFSPSPSPGRPAEQIAFCMFLRPGLAQEYRRRHDLIWPELVRLLGDSGVRDYSIHLDESTHMLFAVLRRTPDHRMDRLPEHPVMQRWWAHMADLMLTNEDRSPVVRALVPMFHLD